ncbi:unnamed protein product [Lepeophtheirus salmonis]|uniref:(salmon louse) hypothetical protein n=1 Tax=Lepeophtheirus salmonis TaxID=72036 RepID=A0A7R8CZ58_LEPSM|nr:unnamed protein product [Lepeophtheirus salmonis]CAF2973120.1 unnamed protein product [Lepeophtheirus salmonis]
MEEKIVSVTDEELVTSKLIALKHPQMSDLKSVMDDTTLPTAKWWLPLLLAQFHDAQAGKKTENFFSSEQTFKMVKEGILSPHSALFGSQFKDFIESPSMYCLNNAQHEA